MLTNLLTDVDRVQIWLHTTSYVISRTVKIVTASSRFLLSRLVRDPVMRIREEAFRHYGLWSLDNYASQG